MHIPRGIAPGRRVGTGNGLTNGKNTHARADQMRSRRDQIRIVACLCPLATRNRSFASSTIVTDVVKEIGVAGQLAGMARRTLAQVMPSRVSRPASSNALISSRVTRLLSANAGKNRPGKDALFAVHFQRR